MKFKIAERRKALGLSKSKLAELVGVHRSTIGRIEKGITFPSTPVLHKLADVLEMDPKDLIIVEEKGGKHIDN